jgi:hypothetical protein
MHGDKLPVINNISLNKRKPGVHGEAAMKISDAAA